MSISNNVAELSLMLDAYNQAGAWADGSALARHERESDKGYNRRRSVFCAPALYSHLIDTFSILWGHAPLRVDMPDPYSLFVQDCGGGLSLDGFLPRALKAALVEGSAWLIMDASAQQPDSYEGMLQERSYPFIELIYAHQVVDIVVDRLGRIRKFVYSFKELNDEGVSTLYYKVLQGGVSTVYSSEWSPVSLPMALPVDMPVVPVVPSGEPLLTGKLPESPTRSLYQGHRSVANTLSLVDESLFSQQFSVLVVTGPDNLSDVVLGASNALKLSEGATASFIAPSGTPVDKMVQRIETAIGMMLKTFASLLTGDQAQSGVAKVLDRQTGSLQLRAMALYMEGVEYKLFEMFQAFLRQPVPADFTVTYYSDFDLVDVANYVGAATQAMGIEGISEEAKLAIRRDVLRKVLGGMDPVELQEVLAAETLPKPASVAAPGSLMNPAPARDGTVA